MMHIDRRNGRRAVALLAIAAITAWQAGAAAEQPVAAAPFMPDPASVERYGPAYRYPQAGWIVLHVEGQPYERGYQHGRLLAPEIADLVRAVATKLTPKSPEDGWVNNRMLVDALFLRRFDEEYLLEMKGIADGAAAAGAKFDGRPLDLVDVVAVNAWTEVEFLDSALRATPHGLESLRFRELLPTRQSPPPPSRCSSFIATGPATRDGKIVFGHITMWSLYAAQHFNVWLDLKPANGHRVLMQSYPGGIQSTTDYYMNDAGLLVSETTLGQTRFNIDGLSEASRIRKALQYAGSIDELVEILKTSNNGLYTNEWLIGDTNTNEIAMFELGTFKSRLFRSSKDEWFGNTAGFYWGCNNTKDLDVRLETVASLAGKPANVVFRPSDRDLMWQKLYGKHRGKIDAAFGFEAFTTPPLAAAHSLDAKFTTADMARELKTWALFGPPLGRTWEPTESERERYPDIRPLVSNGWTLLEAKAPPPGSEERKRPAAVDLASSNRTAGSARARTAAQDTGPEGVVATGPAWHGTILPKTDADVWLASAFADYEAIVSLEKAAGGASQFDSLTQSASDRVNVMMFPYRTRCVAAAATLPDATLGGVRASTESNEWYDLASGKGVWVLAELRSLMGGDRFDDFMDAFGREFAGQRVTAAEFRDRAERAAGRPLAWFFDQWLRRPDWPTLALADVKVTRIDGDWHVHGIVEQSEPPYRGRVQLGLETENGAVAQTLAIGDGRRTPFEISSPARPLRLLVDPLNRFPKANGATFSVQSFERELEQAIIVRGTGPEAASLGEAAELLQRRIAMQWSNYSVPIKSDSDVTEDELKSKHLLLVGRPAMNSVVARLCDALPVRFSGGSFTVADQTFAHPDSAVVAAATNPANPRRSIVVFAGLSAESTRRVAAASTSPCEVLVWPTGRGRQSLVLPARELIAELATESGRGP